MNNEYKHTRTYTYTHTSVSFLYSITEIYRDFVLRRWIAFVCRCKGASHYGLSAERKRRSQEGECTDSTSELALAALPADGPASSAMALLSDEPGLVNPAYEPGMEDNSQSGSTTSLTTRSNSKKSECEWAYILCVCLWVYVYSKSVDQTFCIK